MREEELLDQAFKRYDIRREHRLSILRYLELLRERNEETYRHSIRVGILASQMGEHLASRGIKPKVLFWAGLLHDVGKSSIDPALLEKKAGFGEDDYRQMESHVEYGWRLLSGIHDWTANIIVRHHRFGERPYPEHLPCPKPEYPDNIERTFDLYARILALADYYDALMTRDNERSAGLSAEDKRTKFFRDNEDQRQLIGELEAAGILKFA